MCFWHNYLNQLTTNASISGLSILFTVLPVITSLPYSWSNKGLWLSQEVGCLQVYSFSSRLLWLYEVYCDSIFMLNHIKCLIMCVCPHARVSACAHMPGLVLRSQKRVSVPQKQEWQAVVSHLTWVLATEAASSGKAGRAPNSWATSPAQYFTPCLSHATIGLGCFKVSYGATVSITAMEFFSAFVNIFRYWCYCRWP